MLLLELLLDVFELVWWWIEVLDRFFWNTLLLADNWGDRQDQGARSIVGKDRDFRWLALWVQLLETELFSRIVWQDPTFVAPFNNRRVISSIIPHLPHFLKCFTIVSKALIRLTSSLIQYPSTSRRVREDLGALTEANEGTGVLCGILVGMGRVVEERGFLAYLVLGLGLGGWTEVRLVGSVGVETWLGLFRNRRLYALFAMGSLGSLGLLLFQAPKRLYFFVLRLHQTQNYVFLGIINLRGLRFAAVLRDIYHTSGWSPVLDRSYPLNWFLLWLLLFWVKAVLDHLPLDLGVGGGAEIRILNIIGRKVELGGLFNNFLPRW
jgi:hypothetical protein